MRHSIIFLFLILTVLGCQSKTEQQRSTALDYDTTAVVTEGQKIAKATFQTLSSNLKSAIAKDGVSNALQFCNVEAIPLTDSLSAFHNVTIRRASHKPRNPYNTADSLEAEAIKRYIQKLNSGKELSPITYANEHRITFHAPITITNALCLNCHGQPGTDIAQSDLATIQKLYPKDQATGFSMGDLRGVWTIRFPYRYFDAAEVKEVVQ